MAEAIDTDCRWQVSNHYGLLTPIGVNNKPLVTTVLTPTGIITAPIGGNSEPPVTIATNRIIRGVIGGSDRPSVTIDPDCAISGGNNKPQCDTIELSLLYNHNNDLYSYIISRGQITVV